MNRILCRSIGLYSNRPDKIMTNLAAKELMKKRLADREKPTSKLAILTNNADLQVIGCDSQGYSPCLLLNSEGNSYLFNCAEGTQRLCYANKVRILNIENVFMTRTHSWTQLSGVYGLSLTLQDVGAIKLNIHSAQNLDGFFESTNSFMSHTITGFKCSTVNTRKQRKFSDNGITIETVLTESDQPTNQLDSGEASLKRFKSDANPLVSYLCKLPDNPGALDPEKCRQLNVPVGPKLAVLKSGKDVTLADGTLVKSEDVCMPKTIGTSFLIIDCPLESRISELIESEQIRRLQRNRKISNEQQIDLVVHFSPESVVKNSDYQEWMQSFAGTCKHLLLCNPNSRGLNFEHSYRQQYLLQQMDSELFKSLYIPENRRQLYDSATPSEESKLEDQGNNKTLVQMTDDDNVELYQRKDEIENLDKIYSVEHMDRFFLRPHKFLETLDVIYPVNHVYSNTRENHKFEEELGKLRDLQKDLPKARDHEPEVIFLGTGSALPQKYRNTSCIVLNFHDRKTSAILDCGEDSYGQLYRYYGPEGLDNFLQQLKLIYISHHHVDHHIGLAKILSARRRITRQPLVLIAQPNIESFLNYRNSTFEDINDSYHFYSTSKLKTVPTKEVDSLQMNSIESYKKEVYEQLKGFLTELTIVPVEHCINSCAVVMKFAVGHPEMETFTLGYSGDARPSEDFVIAGRNCDLLIHEATMDHRSKEEAIKKKHSTSSEAIEMGRRMGAEFTLLTHFSQRLSKIPYFNDEFDDKVGFSFDNMAVRCPSHLQRIPIMRPVVEAAFQKELSDIELKYWKQQVKKKMLREIVGQK